MALLGREGIHTYTPPDASVVATNLVYNPSFETGITGWSANASATLSRVTSEALVGDAAMEVICAASASSGTFFFGSASPNLPYVLSAWLKGETGGEILDITLSSYLAGPGAQVQTATKQVTLTTEWQRVDVSLPTSGASAALFAITLYRQTGAPTFYADAVQVTQDDEVRDYFDGSRGGARWTGTAHGSTSELLDAVEINRLDHDDGEPVWPRFKLDNVVHPLASPGDHSDKRVGASGRISRPDYRGDALHTYTIEAKGRDIVELRQGEQALRDAFFDQEAEGRMDVAPHILAGFDPGLERYFEAKPLALDPAGDFEETSSPQHGLKSVHVLGLRNHSGKHYEELTLAAFKQAIIDLGPEAYWALDSIDGVTDLSGNGFNLTAVGSPDVGGAAALTAIPGDSATDLNGSSQYFTSPYSPWTAGSVRTLLALQLRDTHSTIDPIFGSSANFHFFHFDNNDDANFRAGGGTGQTWLDIAPNAGETEVCALTANDATNQGELFIGGTSQGVKTDAFAFAGEDFRLGYELGVGGVDQWFDGKLSHVAIFERALTAQEIADINDWVTSGIRTYS